MGKEILTFGDIEIEKHEFYRDLIRFTVVKKNYKYFIGYLCDDYKIKSPPIMLPKIIVRSYNGQTK